MNTDALAAALGADASAAVHRYRMDVMSEARRRGLRLVDEPLAQRPTGRRTPDPLEIRLTFLHRPGRSELAGRTLRWGPSHGWSSSHRMASAALSHYADSPASALDLVPTPAELLDWATSGFDGPAAPPAGVDLDDDPRAIQRLLPRVYPVLPRAGRPDDGRACTAIAEV